MERFLFTAATGEKFTQERWWAYLNAHPNSSREIVVTHGEFGYNIHGVCMNPHRVIIHAKPGSMRYGDIASVSVCESPGGWSFASDATSEISSPHFEGEPGRPWCYATEYEAIFAGFQQLQKKLKQDQHWVEQMEVARRKREGDDEDAEEKAYNTARLQRIKRLLKETAVKLDYYDPRQMLLF